jgi:hypothetical protein
VQRACRSMSLTLDRGLTAPSGRVHSLRGANRPGPCGVPSSLRQICSRSRYVSMPRQSDRAATARFKPRFMVLSSSRTAPQVDQATHTEASGDFAQLLAAGREETAQQPIPAKLLDLNLPALGATAQPLENPGQLRRDRRLSSRAPHLLSSRYPVRKCVSSVDENGPNRRDGTRSVDMARAICQFSPVPHFRFAVS